MVAYFGCPAIPCWYIVFWDHGKFVMRVAIWSVVVFAIPLLASLLLFYGSLPLRIEAHQIAAERLNLALSSNLRDAEDTLAAFGNAEDSRVYRKLDYLAIFSVLMASLVCALIIPPAFTSQQKLNLLTAMVLALCVAEAVVGFGFLNWFEFGKVAAIGSALAGTL
jgi:predicted membrane channel-forming protein YqfA (hemolysin III family)